MKLVTSHTLIVSSLPLMLALGVTGQENRSRTFDETRNWLQKADAHSRNASFVKLFEIGDERIDDLISALGDSEPKVSINAQRILRYLALPKGVEAIVGLKWCPKTCSSPVLNVLERPLGLEGVGNNPNEIVKKNLGVFEASRFNSGDVTFRMLGHNTRANVALFEVVQGKIFTAGWHAVIQWKDGKWWLISDSNLWVH